MVSLSYGKIMLILILIGAIVGIIYKREKVVGLLKKAKGTCSKRHVKPANYNPESEEEIKFKDDEKSSLSNK